MQVTHSRLEPGATVYAGPLDNEDGEIFEDVKGIKLQTIFGETYIKPLFVIVEMYDRKKYGKAKKEYEKEFTEKERRVIASYQTYLRRWYLQTGIPRKGVPMKLETYDLLVRAANFFGSI